MFLLSYCLLLYNNIFLVGVDVSAIVSLSPSAPVPSDTIVSSPNSETPGSPELPDTGLSQPVDENSDWSTENSWNYEAMIGESDIYSD
jgi:hypothetical protein